MALQKEIDSLHGIQGEYHNIKGYMGDKQGTVITVASYISEEAYRTGAQPVRAQDYIFVYDLNGENVYVQGYTYLKGLEEFTNSVDC